MLECVLSRLGADYESVLPFPLCPSCKLYWLPSSALEVTAVPGDQCSEGPHTWERRPGLLLTLTAFRR